MRVGRGRSDARESPARRPGGAFVVRSVAVGLAAARPDEGEALAVLVVEEIGVDRGVEARIVQLDREVVAVLGGTLGPRCAYFDVMRCTALRGLD